MSDTRAPFHEAMQVAQDVFRAQTRRYLLPCVERLVEDAFSTAAQEKYAEMQRWGDDLMIVRLAPLGWTLLDFEDAEMDDLGL